MSDLAQQIATLSLDRQRLLKQLLEERQRTASDAGRPGKTAIGRIPREGVLPLSASQERMWFEYQLDPAAASSNIATAFRLRGSLRVDALEQAVSSIIRRHDILRTVYRNVEGRPVPEVLEHRPFRLTRVDLTALHERPRLDACESLVREDAARPFDLEHGPMLRGLLIELAPGDAVAVLTVHHIAFDGWSAGVLGRELVAGYGAIEQGAGTLPELAIQYVDFAAWQRARLASGDLQAQTQYWATRLKDIPAAIDLPTDFPRPPRGLSPTGTVRRVLRAGLGEAVADLARQQSATSFMVLLAALDVLLHRLSGQADFVVGTPVAGRGRRELDDLIGCFINTVALRCRLDERQSLRDVLTQVRASTIEALSNQDLPFDAVVDIVQPARDLGRPPVFQVLFVLQNAARQSAGSLSGLTIEPHPVEAPPSGFDFSMTVGEPSHGLDVAIDYRLDLFRPSTIARVLECYERIVSALVESPDTRIADVRLIDAEARAGLVAGWQARLAEHPAATTVIDLFDAQARATPAATALEHQGTRLTYGQLRERSARVAARLAGMGVARGTSVGVAVGRSIDQVAAMLGVLEAGAVYVPLDVTLPPERLGFMMADSRVSAVIGSRSTPLLCPPDVRTIGLDDTEVAEPAGVPGVRPAVDPAQAAYVIYTSGSSGAPKGVVISHEALATHCVTVAEHNGYSGRDRVLQFASVGFDAALEQALAPLVAGAAVVLRDEMLWTPLELHAHVVEEGLTVVDLPPAYAHQWVSEWQQQRDVLPVPRHLRLVVTGGESVAPETYARFAEVAPPHTRLLNAYGPTETTITATVFAVDAGDPAARSLGRVPIGVPLRHRTAYVLDSRGEPLPEGFVGELYIGGEGVALGYLARPDLTAERFLPDLFSPRPGARMYRTGDRARRLDDDSLEFFGRTDQQLKIRGFRIEVGEVETVLRLHPDVAGAVVVPFTTPTRELALAAYVVALQPEQPPAVEALRAFLLERLPNYFIPTAWAVLPALPLNSSGKVDRAALPAPVAAPAAAEDSLPGTPTETQLAAIWCEVLGRSSVGLHDDFFALGGHSLLATQVVSRIRVVFGIEVPLRHLFESSTVAALAGVIDRGVAGEQGRVQGALTQVVPRVTRDGPLPLSFGQQRLWFLDQLDPGRATYNVPLALRLEGELSVDTLERALLAIVQRHEVLRSRIATEEGRPVQTVRPVPQRLLRHVDISGVEPGERLARLQALAFEEAGTPFDLAHDDLFRATLVHLGPCEHGLFLTMHHIVTDGWSMAVFVRELTATYHAIATARPSPLPPLPFQYADYAAWQRAWLQGAVLDEQIDYWRGKLEGCTGRLNLPTVPQRGADRADRGAIHQFAIDAALAARLRSWVTAESSTAFMVALATFKVLLARYTGQTDLSVGTPIANRVRRDLEGLIGFFVNTLVLRTDLSGEPSFREAVARVRQTALDAYEHQDVPFEQLVDALQPERDLTSSPFFQVMFIVQNAPPASAAVEGLALSELDLDVASTAFDMTWTIADQDEGPLPVTVEFNEALLSRGTVEQMARHFVTLLDHALGAPEQPVTRIPMLSAADERLLVALGSGGEAEGPAPLLLERLALQRQERPHAIALGDATDQLTWDEMLGDAEHLAATLSRSGVGPGDIVAVAADRNVNTVVGFLGVMMAGAAFLPVDSAQPRERLALLLADAGVRFALLQRASEPAFGTLPVQTVRLDLLGHVRPLSAQRAVVTAADVAYLVYTSGSTGSPKGVMISHGALAAHCRSIIPEYGLSPADRMLQFLSLTFDAGLEDVLVTLAAGGSVFLRGEEMWTAQEFHAQMTERRITATDLPPVYFKEWVRAWGEAPLAGAELPALRFVVVGGDAFPAETLSGWAALPTSHVRLCNMYGPTEATITATTYTVPVERRSQVAGPERVPIGRPPAGRTAYVVDGCGTLAPLGAVAELYLGGEGLAHGYLGSPAVTAERFVPDPFGTRPGARLYRTGDLVRWREDRSLEFVGRTDQQVKLRGFRIELGEIETRLRLHAAVRDALVVAREDTPGGKRLVAYVIAEPGQAVDAAALRRFVTDALPAYMEPAAIVCLDAWPLTSSGKIDRRRLPVAAGEAQSAPRALEAARSALEQTLVGVWRDVLGIAEIGVHDNFFELGGDSITSIQVVSRARQQGIPLAPRHMFEAPTVAGLAALMGTVAAVAAERDVPVGDVPLTPMQRQFFHEAHRELNHFNFSTLLASDVAVQREALEAAAAAVWRHHDALRARFTLAEGRWTQRVHDAGDAVPFEWVPLGGVADAARAVTAHAATVQASFEIGAGPLLRVVGYDLGPARGSRLLVVAHHLVVDAVSWRILLEDLQTAYSQYARGTRLDLPARTASFRRYAAQLVQRAHDERTLEQVEYWRGRSDGNEGAVPVDRPGGDNREATRDVVTCVLEGDETAALLDAAPAAYRATINELLLAALGRSLAAWAGREAVVVALESHGRDGLGDLDVTRTVGWFTTLFPVRLAVGQVAIRDAVERVKTELRGVPDHGQGFGLLTHLCDDARVRSIVEGWTLPAVSFNYLGQTRGAAGHEGSIRQASESAGPDVGPGVASSHSLDVVASVQPGRLGINWHFDRVTHDRATIERVAAACLDAVRDIINEGRSQPHQPLTPSDFPLAKLSGASLDKVLSRLARRAASPGATN